MPPAHQPVDYNLQQDDTFNDTDKLAAPEEQQVPIEDAFMDLDEQASTTHAPDEKVRDNLLLRSSMATPDNALLAALPSAELLAAPRAMPSERAIEDSVPQEATHQTTSAEPRAPREDIDSRFNAIASQFEALLAETIQQQSSVAGCCRGK